MNVCLHESLESENESCELRNYVKRFLKEKHELINTVISKVSFKFMTEGTITDADIEEIARKEYLISTFPFLKEKPNGRTKNNNS